VKTLASKGGAPGKTRAPDLDRLRTDLESFMNKRGLRSTEQRRLIIDTLFDATEHITIDGLLNEVRAVDPKVGYATVYRTLKMLTESGVVQEHKFGDGHTRYELSDAEHHHDHLICLDCGKITEFEEPAIEELQDRVAARYGFQVQAHKHELYGRCADCRRKNARR
jgi:Fur family ferric uptake transcriptional regulator